MRFFNTTGPIDPKDHYHVPPLSRLDLDEVLMLIEQKRYFVLHAPRQTGKTTALGALMEVLNAGGHYRCVYVNAEPGQAAREDVGAAMRAILNRLGRMAASTIDDPFPAQTWPDILERAGPYAALEDTLAEWAAADSRPLVLLIDEIDALVDDTLISVLRQLRSGYRERPQRFPQSIVLCGVRDVRDYRIHSSAEKAIITGGSAFNIKAESLRLGDFSEDEVGILLAQHTEATGQAFTAEAQALVWTLTRGQPWLVNALAYQACFRNKPGRDRRRPITAEAIQDAREALIVRRDTHLDQLVDKLQEPRVQRVIEPLLSGAPFSKLATTPAIEPPQSGTPSLGTIRPDDLQYVRDLGLVSQRGLAIANPIYQEVIPRELTWVAQETLFHHEPTWYVGDDGRLRVDTLLEAFQAFFREHSEHWVERFQYKEAGPQLLLQAFLQRIVNSGGRIVNSGGRIEREYGVGRRRMDLLVVWPVIEDGHERQRPQLQKVAIECKVVHGGMERTLSQGLEQTCAYMDGCAAEEGHLVLFDRSEHRSWDEKVYRRDETTGDRRITVWGM